MKQQRSNVMPMEVQLHHRGVSLTPLEEERIQRHLASLERRVAKFPDPRLELAIENQSAPRGVGVDLRLALGPLGGHLVSHQEGPAADVAVKAAVDDVKRQLERRLANQRGESTYGVPSRRLPADLRPNPPVSENGEPEMYEEEFLEEEAAMGEVEEVFTSREEDS
jgi:ribosome-associated translation inhibitor RaiA